MSDEELFQVLIKGAGLTKQEEGYLRREFDIDTKHLPNITVSKLKLLFVKLENWILSSKGFPSRTKEDLLEAARNRAWYKIKTKQFQAVEGSHLFS